MRAKKSLGFTLAELLIALMILGQIATFTIPKILASQQTHRYNAIGKEAFSMIAAAHQKAQYDGIITTSGMMKDLTQYMNYVAMDTSSSIDSCPGNGVATSVCSAAAPCLKLHNGAMLKAFNVPFGTTSGYTIAYLDPDGVASGIQDSLFVVLYYNGRTTTYATLNTSYPDPPWFSW